MGVVNASEPMYLAAALILWISSTCGTKPSIALNTSRCRRRSVRAIVALSASIFKDYSFFRLKIRFCRPCSKTHQTDDIPTILLTAKWDKPIVIPDKNGSKLPSSLLLSDITKGGNSSAPRKGSSGPTATSCSSPFSPSTAMKADLAPVISQEL